MMVVISTFLMAISLSMMKSTNPIYLSILILFISLFSSFLIFKTSLNSWFSFVVVLTFSSGMMTLFMYTSSLVSNEITNKKKSSYLLILLIMFICLPLNNIKISSESMKIFSSQMVLVLMSIFLIMSMLSISSHGHHPNQTLSSSF